MSESAVAQALSQSHWYVCLGSIASQPSLAKIKICPLLVGGLNRSTQHRGPAGNKYR